MALYKLDYYYYYY